MALPAFAEIVAQPEVDLPVAGRKFNVNYVLGQENIVGIKTGSSPEAGSAFAFAANTTVAGKAVRIYGVILGQDTLEHTFDRTKALIRAAAPNIQQRKVITAGQEVGRYHAPWGADAQVRAAADVTLLTWPGMTLQTIAALHALSSPAAAGSPAGNLTISLGEQVFAQAVSTSQPIKAPGKRWRLLRNSM
jgi:D-alanyl-D-alanine carboxypeptidase (penicillin-binding protein 5/6)